MIANRAAELGPQKYKWWQDWRGECVAIVASGVSTKHAGVEKLRDRIHVIAIKENVNLCPWAEVVYGCDVGWWAYRRGLPEYKGIKIAHSADARSRFSDINKIEIKSPKLDKILVEEPGFLGSGSNSGFQALNLAVQFGATGILLVGYDMHSKRDIHWYGRNKGAEMSNPDETNFKRWVAAFTSIAPDLKARGIEVVNASPDSAITCFRKASIEEALKGWGL